MFTKKNIITCLTIAVVLTGTASVAMAESTGGMQINATTPKMPMANGDSQKMMVQIGPQGNALVRGTITAVGTSSLTVKSWGGDWVINTSSTTKLMPGADMSQFKVGDFLGAQGTVNQSASWTIDAILVRDWTAKSMAVEQKTMMRKDRRNTVQEIKDVQKSENPKNWQGTISNINVDAKSFTLTVSGTAYTVNLVVDAKVVDQKFLSTDLAKVKEGDTVRVWGPVSSTTISAYVFRDISLGVTKMMNR